jgi:hypothetical protein
MAPVEESNLPRPFWGTPNSYERNREAERAPTVSGRRLDPFGAALFIIPVIVPVEEYL